MIGERRDAGAALVHTAARVFAAGLAWGVAWWIRFRSGWIHVTDPDPAILPGRYLEALPVAMLATLVAARAAGLRFSQTRRTDQPETREYIAAAFLSTLLLLAVALLARDVFQYSRGFLLIYGATLLLALPILERLARATLSARRIAPVSLLIVGGAEPADDLAAAVTAAEPDAITIAGRIGPASDPPGQVPHLGETRDAARLLSQWRPRRVVVLDDSLRGDEAGPLFEALADGTADVGLAWRLPRPPGFPAPDLAGVGPWALAAYWETPLRGSGGAMKRILDVAVTVLLLPLVIPAMLLVALVVRLTSRGPVFHRQVRVGLDGHTFTLWKFRTMVADAEAGTGPVFAAPGDPRRTPAGSFLRRFSLDELPQFLHVLGGSMSLVGPRPERPEFVEKFRREFPGYMLRHSLRAGITGWAQVNGLRGQSGIEERLALDLEYARRWSLLFDLEILVRTVFQVLLGRNAY